MQSNQQPIKEYLNSNARYPEKVQRLSCMEYPNKGKRSIFRNEDNDIVQISAELVSLAENCIQKYGYSVLGTVINADICPHYFFAGVMLGLISADTSFCKDPKAVEEMKKYLKEHVSKDQRQMAKAVNFGLPGKMAAPRLYRHLRENGIKTTMEEAEHLRRTWLDTYTEMKFHFQRTPIQFDQYARYGMKTDEDEYDLETFDDDPAAEKKKGRKLFKTTTITGFVRNRAVESAA